MLENRKIILDLGCGDRKKKGHFGIDKHYFSDIDVIADIDKGLPLKDDVVDGVYSNYFLEHVADVVSVFREIYRVCKKDARVVLTVPYYTSINAFKDPTHLTFFTEDTFRYFSRDKWYGSDYKIGTNFKMISIKYHYSKAALLLFPFRRYLRKYFLNMVGAITVTLKVVK